MYKKIAEFLSAQEMAVTKNTAYGIVRGYETNVAYNAIGTFPVVFHISFHATDGQRGAIASVLQGARLKFFTMQFTPFGISFGINDLTGNRLVKRLPSILDLVYGALTSNEVSGADSYTVILNGVKVALVTECAFDTDGFLPVTSSVTAEVIANCSVSFVKSADCKAEVNAFLEKLMTVKADAASAVSDEFYYLG